MAASWESEIAKFEKADREQGVGKVDVLLYGSSSFRMWNNVAAEFPGITLLNRGFGGSQLSDLNEFFDRVVVPHAPRLLLIYGGDNDVASGKSAETILRDFETLVARVKTVIPDTRVVFVAIKYSPSREKFMAVQRDANRRIRRFAGRHRGVDYMDTATPLLNKEGRPDPSFFLADKLHLNSAGYEVWREILGGYFARHLKR